MLEKTNQYFLLVQSIWNKFNSVTKLRKTTKQIELIKRFIIAESSHIYNTVPTVISRGIHTSQKGGKWRFYYTIESLFVFCQFIIPLPSTASRLHLVHSPPQFKICGKIPANDEKSSDLVFVWLHFKHDGHYQKFLIVSFLRLQIDCILQKSYIFLEFKKKKVCTLKLKFMVI